MFNLQVTVGFMLTQRAEGVNTICLIDSDSHELGNNMKDILKTRHNELQTVNIICVCVCVQCDSMKL